MYMGVREEFTSLQLGRQLGHHHAEHGDKCPDGYTGANCSIKLNQCFAKRSDLVNGCYYGSACIDAPNEFGLLDRFCECNTAEELAAGLMCQYKATSICLAEADVDKVTDQYCVNSGVCIAFVGAGGAHPGCMCEEGKWEGRHCEFTHGLMMDDALDLFQQRKVEIVSEQKMTSGSGSDLRATANLAREAGQSQTLLLIYSGFFVAIIAAIATVGLTVRAARKYKSSSQQADDHDYESIKLGSVASKVIEPTHKSSLPPPADVFLSSRKKEVDSDDGGYCQLSSGNEADADDDNAGDVEVLDAETSRMIEAQFKSCGSSLDEERIELKSSDDESGESAFALSYESDGHGEDRDAGLMRCGRITINSGKNPLSKLQLGLIEDDEMALSKIEEDNGSNDHVNENKHLNDVISFDGECDDDSDGDSYFV